MSSTLLSLVVGLLFGLALAAPPGPMNAIIAEESVLRGWRAGFVTGIGAMLADVLFFVLVFLGVATLIGERPALQQVFFLVGGGLMLVFSVDAAREARAASGFTDDSVSTHSRGFQKAFALSLSNPYQLAFWLTAGIGLVQPGTLSVTEYLPAVLTASTGDLVVATGSPALLVGFFGGIGVWVIGYPAALVKASERLDALAPLIAAGSALVLGGFGVLFVWIGVTGLLY